MKLIFVGVHNKPHMQPLDSSTKSGKIIDRIIAALPGHECLKCNLYDVDQMPNALNKYLLKTDFMERWTMNLDNDRAVFILLGAIVHREFPRSHHRKAMLAHPASSCYTGKKDEQYINESLVKIKKCLYGKKGASA